MIAGGAEAPITPIGVGGFAIDARAVDAQRRARRGPAGRSTATATASSSARAPASWSSRSSSTRSGAARTIYAEVVGYGADRRRLPHHRARPRTATAPCACMRMALRDAGRRRRSTIDYINAHGTSTPLNDTTETLAIKTRLRRARAQSCAMSSTKSMTGHLLGAAGGLEAGITALAVRAPGRCRRPSTSTTRTRSATSTTCRTSRGPRRIRYALSNSFGFGGTNAALLFKAYEDR